MQILDKKDSENWIVSEEKIDIEQNYFSSLVDKLISEREQNK